MILVSVNSPIIPFFDNIIHFIRADCLLIRRVCLLCFIAYHFDTKEFFVCTFSVFSDLFTLIFGFLSNGFDLFTEYAQSRI